MRLMVADWKLVVVNYEQRNTVNTIIDTTKHITRTDAITTGTKHFLFCSVIVYDHTVVYDYDKYITKQNFNIL